MSETWTHKFTSTRKAYSLAREYGRKRANLSVEAGLQHLNGNARPYFSVTGELFSPGHRRNPFACGCLHDHILQFWPKLAPVIALHLCDDTGSPMHAEANGWYQLAGYYGGAEERYHAGNGKRQMYKPDGTFDAYREPTPDECLQSWAEHVRIPLDEARRIADVWAGDRASWADARRMYGQWLAAQAERYQAEATAACNLLDTLAGRVAV